MTSVDTQGVMPGAGMAEKKNRRHFVMESIRGIVLPAPTVFLEDGRVDESLMRDLTEYYVACGVHAFFVDKSG